MGNKGTGRNATVQCGSAISDWTTDRQEVSCKLADFRAAAVSTLEIGQWVSIPNSGYFECKPRDGRTAGSIVRIYSYARIVSQRARGLGEVDLSVTSDGGGRFCASERVDMGAGRHQKGLDWSVVRPWLTRHETARHDTVRHSTTRHDTTRHGVTRHDTTRDGATRHDTA